MNTEQSIKLYSLSCGLYVNDSLFAPFANVSANYITDLNLVLKEYESINVESFDRNDVLYARLRGHKTFNKTILCVEMPISIYEDLCLKDDNGDYLTKDEAQYRTNEYVWHESAKFLDNIKDELFEIDGKISSLEIRNTRSWTTNEILN